MRYEAESGEEFNIGNVEAHLAGCSATDEPSAYNLSRGVELLHDAIKTAHRTISDIDSIIFFINQGKIIFYMTMPEPWRLRLHVNNRMEVCHNDGDLHSILYRLLNKRFIQVV